MVIGGWLLGVVASLCGSLCGTLGVQLRIRSLDYKGCVAFILQAIGWTSWLIGQGLGQVAILLAPTTIAACVTFSGCLVCNALMAPVILQEHLTLSHTLGVVLLALGGGCVTVSSDHSSQEYTWPHLKEMWANPWFLGAFGCCIVVTCGILLHTLYRRKMSRQPCMSLHGFAFLFAVCGACDLLAAKFTLQLMRLCAEGRHNPNLVLPSGSVVAIYFTVMIVLHVAVFFFQVASAYFRQALIAMPLFLGSGCIMQVCLCGFFFQEFATFDRKSGIGFLGGLVVVMVGLVVTSRAPGHDDEEPAPKPIPDDSASDGKSPTTPTSEPFFKPPTANPDELSGSRSIGSFKSADILLVGELNRYTICFGGHYTIGSSKSRSQLPYKSVPLLAPLLETQTGVTPAGPMPASAPARAYVQVDES